MLSIDPIIDQFADALWLSDGLARNTIESYRRDVTQLHDWLLAQKRVPLIHVAADDLKEFLAHRVEVVKSSARSTARLTSALKRFFHTDRDGVKQIRARTAGAGVAPLRRRDR